MDEEQEDIGVPIPSEEEATLAGIMNGLKQGDVASLLALLDYCQDMDYSDAHLIRGLVKSKVTEVYQRIRQICEQRERNRQHNQKRLKWMSEERRKGENRHKLRLTLSQTR